MVIIAVDDEKLALEGVMLAINKAKPNALNKLPIGTVIKFIAPYDMVQYKKGDEITVTKKVRSYSRKRTNTFWVSGNYYYSTKTIGNDYEIVRKAVGNV